jgi:hypothetical protein
MKHETGGTGAMQICFKPKTAKTRIVPGIGLVMRGAMNFRNAYITD